MTIVRVGNTALEYKFERLDYIAVEPHEYSYVQDYDDDEIKFGHDFAVVAWGLDTDGVHPWEKPRFCGRFVSYHDVEQDAREAALKLATELNVPVKW